MRLFFLIVAALTCVAGCARPISRPSLNLVDPSVSFAALRQNPERYRGSTLLLGGAIAAVRGLPGGGSDLEMVQFPTDRSGRITATNTSGGRFIVRDTVFRDPAIYRPGRLMTLVGTVEGAEQGQIGDIDYSYPVLTVHELHLWPEDERPGASPVRFGIGIGVGTAF
ncbi:starvation-inducible outer membrane lipoprotein [Desulfuromonas soudanensis]|uniref:Starvation-inducible outer membrane lipoprotein n=1 Tax=Desulfuromonas soudanensis TaxID=1603606 RepID=A0A0M5IR41_9BACT|nr:Slp family lipoprotein [Desulfuromonas soudanensis]ALC15586.1 starvation-inducible outer membrane lipoprotein [Desulfuromonas soudanensis]